MAIRELAGGGLAGAERFFYFGYVGWVIDGDAFVSAFGDADVVAVFQPAELLQLFKPFKFAWRQRRKLKERIAAKHVEAYVFVMERGDAFAGIAHPGDGRTRKIKSIAVEIEDHFDNVRVHDFSCMGNWDAERGDLHFRVSEDFVNRRVDCFSGNKWFIALHVYVNLSGYMDGDLGDALGAGAMFAARHDGLAAEGCDGVADAVIVGSYDDAGRTAAHFRTFDHVLNHGASRNGRQRFPGKTRRVVTRRNYHDDRRPIDLGMVCQAETSTLQDHLITRCALSP